MPTETQGQAIGTDSQIEESEIEGIESEQPEADATEQAADAAQDQEADAESEEDNPDAETDDGVKDAKTGNFDWKKISEKIGGEVEKAFRESQRTISRVSQENKQLREQTGNLPQLKEQAERYQYFDRLVAMNPALRAQVQAAMSGTQQPQAAPRQEIQLPEGVNPNDPLAPLVMQLLQGQQRFEQQSQQSAAQQQQQRYTEDFRQGLIAAKGRFKAETGRDMSEQELRTVAENMRSMNVLKGDLLVPGLFISEIRKAEQRKFFESRKAKKQLPKTPVGGRGQQSGTAKTMQQAFDEAWEKENGRG